MNPALEELVRLLAEIAVDEFAAEVEKEAVHEQPAPARAAE